MIQIGRRNSHNLAQQHRNRLLLWRWLGATAAAMMLLGGCGAEHPQSVLHPAGPAAEKITALWWFLFGVCTAVFLIVLVLLAVGVFRRPSQDKDKSGPPMGGTKFVVITGIVVPTIILVVMLVVALNTTLSLRMPSSALTIRVTGHQWWWGVEYPEQNIITANEVHIPVGRPVRVVVRSNDVIHSFWVPALNGKIDALPEHDNSLWIQADSPGTYRGQCAEYCGTQHALMAFNVVALAPEDFDKWVLERQKPTEVPDTAAEKRGQKVFFDASCNSCHAIGGTRANGRMGPDLTHIGSRSTLAAATITNTPENLNAWLLDPQSIKPGNLMPPSKLSQQELQDLNVYFETLQ